MSQLMAENVNDHRARQTEKRDQPEDRTQGEEPELFTGPKAMSHGRAREDGEESLGEDRADRQKKNRDDEFHPPGWDHPGVGDGMAARDGCGDFDATRTPARSVMKRCFPFLLRRHVNRRLRRLTARKEVSLS